jgi:predicted nucleic acid-binding protein
MRVVLDTCVLVAESMPQLPDNALLAVSSLSYAEMQFGVGCGADAVERARRLARLERVRLTYGPGLAFNDDVAVSYGIVAQTVASRGRVIRGRQVNLMIAATAHAHGAALMTANAADFAGLDDMVEILAAP